MPSCKCVTWAFMCPMNHACSGRPMCCSNFGSQNSYSQLIQTDFQRSVSGSSYHECQLSERLNGKYVSVKVSACMQSPDMIASVFQELGKDPRVVMKY
jgi:putative lipoic acid-binding regulatory protein